MSLWENLKKGLIEGIQTASDKTSEYTKIGRIKIDVLGIKKELEENLIELGGRVYHRAQEEKKYDIREDNNILQLIEKVRELEAELTQYDEELKRLKKDEGIDLD